LSLWDFFMQHHVRFIALTDDEKASCQHVRSYNSRLTHFSGVGA
jgi:hypothetical protein